MTVNDFNKIKEYGKSNLHNGDRVKIKSTKELEALLDNSHSPFTSVFCNSDMLENMAGKTIQIADIRDKGIVDNDYCYIWSWEWLDLRLPNDTCEWEVMI